MTNYLRNLVTASMIAIVPAMAQNQFGELPAPNVPSAIQVPAGNTAFLKGYAEGTQNYICIASTSGYSWRFIGPQATLFLTFKWFNGEIRQQITTHYLSANPSEGGTHRAAWQSSLDTSTVWAKAIASSTDPAFVAPGAIPWLLLQAVGSRKGPTGGAILTPATFLQRVDTTGGVMPSTGCSEARNVGDTVFVPYTANYVFYKASRKN
ncbi:MAG: DUF3455 domain-containing protein [Bryobacteraceae bacterium]